MRSGTQPGLGQHWHTALGEAFSGVWDCFPGLRTGSDGGKVRPRCSPAYSRAIMLGKKQPGLGQHWRTAQGEAFSGVWG